VRTPLRHSIAVAAAIAALLLGACGGDDQESGSDVEATATTSTTAATATTAATGATTATTAHSDGMDKTEFKITAKNIAFSPDKLTIPLAKEVKIVFDNRDNAVPHNIHFKTPTDVKTDVKEGKSAGVKDTVQLNVDKAGTYDFLCDVHPTMKGELTVE
jgi:plastocyanin